jgi:hypothetical protein
LFCVGDAAPIELVQADAKELVDRYGPLSFDDTCAAVVKAVDWFLSDPARANEVLGAVQSQATLDRQGSAKTAGGTMLRDCTAVPHEHFPNARLSSPLIMQVDEATVTALLVVSLLQARFVVCGLHQFVDGELVVVPALLPDSASGVFWCGFVVADVGHREVDGRAGAKRGAEVPERARSQTKVRSSMGTGDAKPRLRRNKKGQNTIYTFFRPQAIHMIRNPFTRGISHINT